MDYTTSWPGHNFADDQSDNEFYASVRLSGCLIAMLLDNNAFAADSFVQSNNYEKWYTEQCQRAAVQL